MTEDALAEVMVASAVATFNVAYLLALADMREMGAEIDTAVLNCLERHKLDFELSMRRHVGV